MYKWIPKIFLSSKRPENVKTSLKWYYYMDRSTIPALCPISREINKNLTSTASSILYMFQNGKGDKLGH